MTFQAGALLPAARVTDLVTTETADATLVYDLTRHELHQLNPVASAIWGLLNDQRTATDVLVAARAKLGPDITIESVQLALATLAQANLLDGPVEPGTFTGGNSRRRFLKVVGLAAVPAIVSVSAPMAASATSSSTCAGAVQANGCVDTCNMGNEGMLSCSQWQANLPCKVCVNTATGGPDRPWDYQWNSWWCSPSNPYGARSGSC